MRKFGLEKDEAGIWRLFLNNRPCFHYGPLDQGYWPDGLYTAPTDEALRFDVELCKKLGFNTIRKHVKVEPARWYYHCDRLGIVVWQDMPNGGKAIGGLTALLALNQKLNLHDTRGLRRFDGQACFQRAIPARVGSHDRVAARHTLYRDVDPL